VGIVVDALVFYPVKGCAGIAVEAADVGVTGLSHDRSFMVVDAVDGAFRSQRRKPAMAAIHVRVLDDGARLALRTPGMPELLVAADPEGPRRDVSMFDRPIGEGVDQGDEAAEWFSDVLAAKSRLVRVPPDFDRDGWGETPGTVGFADAHALLVTSAESLADLNRRIVARGGQPVGMERFRPNIVLAGCAEPHDEDRVRRMTVGDVDLAYAVRAMRCSVPMVDQRTGLRAGPEPIRTLAAYRREPAYGNRVSFGMKAAVLRPGRVAIGDPVHVSAWED
jgi:hypothetical protein